jgi:hypothetical protein
MLKKSLVLLFSLLFFTIASCGTIIKDGKGGSSNELDIKVVVLDSLGLLLFIVPGVIAFALDFNNRTIYK